MKPITSRLRSTHRLVLLAVSALAALTFAASAVAGPGLPPGEEEPPPPPPAAKPNLAITAASVVAAAAQWQVTYTVTNYGSVSAPSFHVDTHEDGLTLRKSTAHASLAAGASRSETMTFARTTASDCYLAVRLRADARNVVDESSELNDRWEVGDTGPNCSTLPRYQVKATSFRAVDETGIDWMGADEIWWTFSSVGIEDTARTIKSWLHEGVDTGDTRSFSFAEGCIYLACSGGTAPNGMGFSIQAWEKDLGKINESLQVVETHFRRSGHIGNRWDPTEWLNAAYGKVSVALDQINAWQADDLIGSQTYAYAPRSLAMRLPTVGGSFDETRTYSGGGGVYTMTVRVSRTA